MFLVGDGDIGTTGVMGEVGRNSDANEAAGLPMAGSRMAVTAAWALCISTCSDSGAWWKLHPEKKKEKTEMVSKHEKGRAFKVEISHIGAPLVKRDGGVQQIKVTRVCKKAVKGTGGFWWGDHSSHFQVVVAVLFSQEDKHIAIFQKKY